MRPAPPRQRDLMGLPLLLVVDDESTDRLIVERRVQTSYRVDGAATLTEALDHLRGGTPEAVVVDLSLGPGHDDWSATLAALSEATPAPLVVWTGHAHATAQPLRGLLLRAGADAVVEKGSGEQLAALCDALSDARDRRHRDRQLTLSRMASVERTLARLAELVEQLGRRVEQLAEPPPAPEPIPQSEIEQLVPEPKPPGALQRLAAWSPQRIAGTLAGLGVVGSLLGGAARAVYNAWHGEMPLPISEPAPTTEVIDEFSDP